MATSRTEGPAGRLIPVTNWSEHHPWPPLGGLRHLIFHADTNGFHVVIRRVGRCCRRHEFVEIWWQ
jgi:hypothetical protein